eukprot:2390652-Amphidinium_carterae.1
MVLSSEQTFSNFYDRCDQFSESSGFEIIDGGSESLGWATASCRALKTPWLAPTSACCSRVILPPLSDGMSDHPIAFPKPFMAQ